MMSIEPLFLNRVGFTEILLLALLVVLLFGAKKIPEVMRGMGRGVKEFKDAMNGEETSKKEGDKTEENK